MSIPKWYTIGHTESYDKYLNEEPNNAYKLGKNRLKNYKGGIVFSSIEDSKKYIDINMLIGYSVYELHINNIMRDTYIKRFDNNRYLLNNAKILRKIN